MSKKFKSRRWIVEGTWSGYTSSQTKVVHRHVVHSEKHAKAIEALACITYTDGTTLSLTVRKAKPYERVKKQEAYTKLINDCIYTNCNSVAELHKK